MGSATHNQRTGSRFFFGGDPATDADGHQWLAARRVAHWAQAKVEEISALEERLAQNKAQLLLVIEGIEGKPEGMACADNAQMLINRLREEGVGQASGKRAVTSSTRKNTRQASGA